ELSLKGLDRELIAEILAERAGQDEAPDDGFGRPGLGSAAPGTAAAVEPGADRRAAENLLKRRGTALARIADPRARRQRAYALLARNGFSPEICREASAHLVVADSTDDEVGDEL
ncbi:MAG: hypothetical protein ACXWM8_01340, partial [Candidatus Limnocylindrales bacterium]